jgi:hypothetical protein
MKRAILAVFALQAQPAGAEETGWSVGAGGKVYGGARSACDGFLKDTASNGVTHVVERMTPTDAGDQMCRALDDLRTAPMVRA